MLLSPTTVVACVLCVIHHVAQGAGDQLPFQVDRTDDSHTPVLDDEFAGWLEETGNARGMKGVAIAVTRKNKDGDGWTTETKGFGVADRWGTPVDDEIKDILPKSLWGLQDPTAQDQADLVDILSHRTGLPRHDLSYSRTDTPESSVAKLRYLRPSAEFRQTFQYSNQMYSLAAHIISHLTGTPFQTYITRNIISSLGMNSTTYNITEALKIGTVADGFVDTADDGTENVDPKRRFKPVRFWDEKGDDLIAGAGGVISNAKDMATWLQALILHGRSPETNVSVIPPSVLDKVTDGITIMPRGPDPEVGPTVYGMGQERYTYQGHEFIEHNGATIGHYSIVTRSAHDNLGVAILLNSMNDPAFLSMIKWRLLEKSLALKHIDWNKRYPPRERKVERHSITQGPPPSDDTPSILPRHELAGVYFNPAYGTLTLCSYPPSKPFEPTRKECEGLISEALQPILNKSAPALIAAMPKLWLTHVLFHHNSGDKFDGRTVLTFPAPFPHAPKTDDDSRPFALPLDVFGSAEFVYAKRPAEEKLYVEGIACRGLWGAGFGVKAPKGEGREGAEVWFDRVA